MTSRVRRFGTVVALSTGLSLIGLSIGGMASLDADLRAAADQRPGNERVRIIDAGSHDAVRECERRRATPSREA
jgi:hypothetical protein